MDQPDPPILQHFTHAHLPPHLQAVSRPLGEIARSLAEDLPPGPERDAGLRKLLEAKDCFVRAAIEAAKARPAGPTDEPTPVDEPLREQREHPDAYIVWPGLVLERGTLFEQMVDAARAEERTQAIFWVGWVANDERVRVRVQLDELPGGA